MTELTILTTGQYLKYNDLSKISKYNDLSKISNDSCMIIIKLYHKHDYWIDNFYDQNILLR